jgi:hypothetical protein
MMYLIFIPLSGLAFIGGVALLIYMEELFDKRRENMLREKSRKQFLDDVNAYIERQNNGRN